MCLKSSQKLNSRLSSEPEGKCLDCSWLTHTLYPSYRAKAAQRIPRILSSMQEMTLEKSSGIWHGMYQVRARCLSWHGAPQRLPVTVTGKTASKSCHESLCPGYDEGPLCGAEKFGVKENTQLLAHGPYGACIPKSGNMELHLLGVLLSV